MSENASHAARPAADPAELPLVSVVLASRNRERYVAEALASLAAQTYPRLELVLVNDGSTDGTGRILADFAAARPDARLIETGGLGPAGARARALETAKGELLALQDDDDRSHPERIERQVRFLIEHPAVVLVGTAADIIDERGRVLGPHPVPHGHAAIRRILERRPPFVHGSVMIRRDAYRAAGGYRKVFPVVEDYDLYLRLPAHGRLENLPETLYAWRLHADNTLERRESDHFFFLALARTFRDERRARGADSAALLERDARREAFLAAYPLGGRLLAYLGEGYARVGRTADAWRVLARSLARGGARPRALGWMAAALGIGVLRRARRSFTRGGVPLPGRSR